MGTDSQLQERTSGYWLGEGWGNSKIGEGDKGLCKINKTQITMQKIRHKGIIMYSTWKRANIL